LEKSFITSKQEDVYEFNGSGMDSLNEYVSHMKKEIQFLREQVKSKDDIINSILSHSTRDTLDKNINKKILFTNENYKAQNANSEKTTTGNDFEVPKRFAKSSQSHKDLFSLKNSNRYESLSFDGINDDNDSISNEINSKTVNSNVTYRKKQKIEGKSNTSKRCVAVIGDSIIKEIKGHLLTTEEERVVVKSFPGATTKQMYHYANPTLEMKPDTLIIHCGTNDLKHTEDDKQVVDSIMDLAMYCCEKNEIPLIISSLTCREDRFKHRINHVNQLLKVKCEDRNIGFINHDNIIGKNHLNRSKLHLNAKGTSIMAKKLKEVISN